VFVASIGGVSTGADPTDADDRPRKGDTVITEI